MAKNPTMTFHESYGSLPHSTLRLIRKHNVSPADFDMILDSGIPDWDSVNHHITDERNNPHGTPAYVGRFF